MQKLTSFYGNIKQKENVQKILGNPLIIQIIKMVIIIVVIIVVMIYIRKLIFYTLSLKHDRPWLIPGSKSAKNSMIISQDPKNENAITLYRSDGQDGGMQFSYSFWFVIENMDYKFGEWKHIFHKGNKTSYPNRAPGVFIHETENKIRVYMNTYDDILEYVDIENIPIKRWVHMAIVLDNKFLDVYVNGYLRKRHKLSSLAKQNFGDVWVNLFGGYDGLLSKLRYYRKAIEYKEIESIVREGPSTESCSSTGNKPPYLADSWWFDI